MAGRRSVPGSGLIPISITESKQLVVEGRDAVVFFQALLREIGLTGVQVQNFGGNDDLHRFLRAFRLTPDFVQVGALGVVRDAETNARAAFQSVCSALGNAELTMPPAPLQHVGHNPKVGVLILPNATTPGMLETLCLDAVAGDPVMSCVTEYLNCVAKQTGQLPGNIDKARVQAFLASRPRPGLLLGQAAARGYWPWASPAFDHVKAFLRTL